MAKYYVSTHETYNRDYKVEANSKQEAIQLVRDGAVRHYDEDFVKLTIDRYSVKTEEEEEKPMAETLPTFPKTQLVSLTLIKQLIDEKEIIHCQTLANSVEEAIENAKTKYGNVELNAWGARMLPGEDGSILHGGGPLVPSKYDDDHPEAIAAINP